MNKRLNLIISSLALTCPILAQAPSWSQHQGNASHNGYVPVSIDPGQLSLRWQDQIFLDRNLAHPVAANGYIVIGNHRTELHGVTCYDHVTGEEYWSNDFATFDPSYVSNPAIHGSSVLVEATHGSYWGELYLIDCLLGYEYLAAPTVNATRHYFAPCIYGQSAFLPSGNYSGVAMHEIATGLQQWMYTLNKVETDWTPAADNDRVYLYQGGKFIGLDRLTGSVDFLVPDPNWVSSTHDYPTPMIGDLDNVILCEDSRVMSWDRNTGIQLWESAGLAIEPSAIHGGVIYGRSYSGSIVALSEIDGSFSWEWTPPGGEELYEQLVLTDTHVFGASLSHTYAINLSTHLQDWSYPAGGKLALGPANLVIADWYGTLHAVGYRDVPEPTSLDIVQKDFFDPGLVTVTITGSGFEHLSSTEVFFGDEEADDVVIVDANTITCTVPDQDAGVVDVLVRNQYGKGLLQDGFAYTPCQTLDGDFVLGGVINLGLHFNINDGIVILYDYGSLRSQGFSYPPYKGELWLEQFTIFFDVPTWPFDNRLDLNFTLPNNPSLIGETIQLQSVIGPNPHGKVAAFTNPEGFTIQ